MEEKEESEEEIVEDKEESEESKETEEANSKEETHAEGQTVVHYEYKGHKDMAGILQSHHCNQRQICMVKIQL